VSLPSLVIPFIKASACGNDFLLIDLECIKSAAISGSPVSSDLPALTHRLCERHEGVGADGVEWMYPHPSADVEIRLINADGSDAEISGNGTRCVAAYVCASQEKEKITIQTGAGLKTCVLTARTESEYEFEAEMGEAAVGAELTLRVTAGRGEVCGIPVSMGNPHYVIFVSEFAENWQTQAAEIQRSSKFPQGVNVELVVIDGKHDVTARFFERGVGETRSSGTGSCASAVAAMAAGKAESPVRVHTPGGTQTVRTERIRKERKERETENDQDRIFLRGSARLVCRGEFFLT
jgi:diaminopimelate epimerase